MKRFTQFINENSQASQHYELMAALANAMNVAGQYANASVNQADNSIRLSSNWELDTMKISGLGRVEPTAYYVANLVPKFNKEDSTNLGRLIQLGLGNVSDLLEGFTITTALSVDVYEVEDYEFKDGPDTNEYTLEELDIQGLFDTGDIGEAGEALIEWWDETANEYGYMLYTRVAEDLESYMASRQPDEEDDDSEEEDAQFINETAHDNFKRLHQLGLANIEINIENLDDDSQDTIDSIKNDVDEVSTIFGKDIMKISGQISTDIILLLIYLVDGSIIQVDAYYQTGPSYSNRDYCRLFIKSNKGEFDVVLKEEDDDSEEEDSWLQALEDYNSVLIAIMKLSKPYL